MTYNNFNSYRCNVCFSLKLHPIPKLRSCQGCKLILYCGIEHQKIDWDTHKDFCRKIKKILNFKKINNILDITPETKSIPKCTQVKRSMQQAVFLLSNLLKRSLTDWENLAILSAKMCNLCCDYNSTLEIDCPKCHNVFYCSLKHLKEDEKNHLEICREFKISFETDLHDYREIEIFDIEKQKKRSQSFPTDLQAMINLLSKPESRSLISYAPFTWVATIINVMRKTIGIFDHQHRTNLVIDIVGTEAEVCHFNENCIKVIFHLFKMLQKIRFNFCGPNLEVISYMNRQYSFDGKRVEFTFDQRVYEECGSCSTPDIIISFNCGFHEIQNCFNPWYKAILKMILYKNVPVVFTSYTFKESKKDLDVVLSIAKNVKSTIEIVSLNEKNPFRNPYPLKNVYRFLEVAEQNESIEAFYYINNYICIFYSPGNDIPTN